MRRAGAPAQATDPVVTDRGSKRCEDEVRRQAGEQFGHRFGDRGMTFGRSLRLVQHGVFGMEFADRLDALCGVALAEHSREVRLHQAVVVDRYFR